MRLLRTYLDQQCAAGPTITMSVSSTLAAHEKTTRARYGERMEWAADATKHNTGTVLTLALNCGAPSELVDAFRALVERGGTRTSYHAEDITEAGYPAAPVHGSTCLNPDLLIRTSGEMRISNFLLWQIAYAENVVRRRRLWPDFRGIHMLEAIDPFQKRERRYGGLADGSESDDVASLPANTLVPR